MRTKIYLYGEKERDIYTIRDKFRIDVFNFLLDKLRVQLEKSMVYKDMGDQFKFLINWVKNTQVFNLNHDITELRLCHCIKIIADKLKILLTN